jgi:branched-subunit amino acid ABC-type transport system permease component
MSGHDDGQDARVAFSLQELVNGITTGALYALVTLSFTMVCGVLKLLNFAQTLAAGASSSIC